MMTMISTSTKNIWRTVIIRWS